MPIRRRTLPIPVVALRRSLVGMPRKIKKNEKKRSALRSPRPSCAAGGVGAARHGRCVAGA